MAKRRRGTSPANACTCGSATPLEACCGPIVAGDKAAPTAEALMRSRYTAFATGHLEHLVRSWHPDTRPTDLHLAAEQTWLGLRVIDTTAGSALDASGEVEFVATYRTPAGVGELRERSRFVRLDGRWVYAAPIGASAQDS